MADNTCQIEGCGKPRLARGWCSAHYAKWRLKGDPLAGVAYGGAPDTCTVEGCNRPHKGRGLCDGHLQRARRGADVTAPLQARYSSPDEAFAARTQWSGDCLLWTGPMNDSGYGLVKIGGRVQRAHRYAWEQARGPIPDGLYVDHACHNRACVNVEHLRPATHAQNEANRSGATVNSQTGVRGVTPHRRSYVAKVGGTYLGTFPTIAEAEAIVEAERTLRFGDFAGN